MNATDFHSAAQRQRKYETLDDLRAEIERQEPDVDVKPYSHNIITLCLGEIAKRFGQQEANKAIDDFNLEWHGWSQR